VVLGTVRGDIHDIGKDIVGIAQEHKPQVLAISGFLSVAFDSMKSPTAMTPWRLWPSPKKRRGVLAMANMREQEALKIVDDLLAKGEDSGNYQRNPWH